MHQSLLFIKYKQAISFLFLRCLNIHLIHFSLLHRVYQDSAGIKNRCKEDKWKMISNLQRRVFIHEVST